MSEMSRGMSLVSVLVAVAMLGILGAALATVFGNMTNLMLRSNIGTDSQNLTRLAQSILNNPNLCSWAMKNGAAKPTWTWKVAGAQGVVTTLVINPGGNNPAPPAALTVGALLSAADLRLQSMYLRVPDPNRGEGRPTTAQVMRNGKVYDSVTAKLILLFRRPQSLVGGGFDKEQAVDVIVDVDPTTWQVASCFSSQSVQAIDWTCNSARITSQAAILVNVAPIPTQCPAINVLLNQPPDPYCNDLYYLGGFDDAGTPICKCQVVCGGG